LVYAAAKTNSHLGIWLLFLTFHASYTVNIEKVQSKHTLSENLLPRNSSLVLSRLFVFIHYCIQTSG